MSLKHLKNIEFVVNNSEHVMLDKSKIKHTRKIMQEQTPKYWTQYCPAAFENLNKEELTKALFLFNSTSFSYWKEEPWVVEYEGNNSKRGSWSNFLSIKRAIDEGIPILDANYQANASNKDFAYFWRAKESIPMLKTRAKFVRENAEVLLEKYQGDPNNLIEESGFDAIKLTELILKDFETFKDTDTYKGQEVTFNKRAQLFAADIHYLVKPLTRVEELSGCADYKIPITLEYHGIMKFSSYLKEKIDDKKLIEDKSIITEIRANELYAMELLAGQTYSAMEANNFLWVTWQDIPKEKQNYVRFRSTGC